MRAAPSASNRRIVPAAFIDDELIHERLPNLGRRLMRVVGGPGTLLLTLWIKVRSTGWWLVGNNPP